MASEARPESRARIETYRAMQNLTTPHPPECYPGLLVVRPGPAWPECVIVPSVGDSFVARGGEYVLGYTTRSGGEAQRFVLRPGDRATKVRQDLPFHLAEWRIERAGLG